MAELVTVIRVLMATPMRAPTKHRAKSILPIAVSFCFFIAVLLS
jgi:hypothetical protein